MLTRIAQRLKRISVNEDGFTLVELIIVIAILGLIMALIIPNILASFDTARGRTDTIALQRVSGWIYQYQALDPTDSDVTVQDLVDKGIIRSDEDMPVMSDKGRVEITSNVPH